MTEPAYRKAHNLGSGAAGGVGLGDEFVLVDTKVSSVASTSASTSASPKTPAMASGSGSAGTGSGATGTAMTCSDQGTAYRLTGALEDKLKPFVGHHIEVTGRIKKADATTSTSATTTAGTSQGLPAEVEIVSYRETSGAGMTSEPVEPATQPTTTSQPRSSESTPATSSARPTSPEPSSSPSTTTSDRRDLPHTASSTSLVAIVGAFALSVAAALTLRRRRVF